MFTDNPDFYPTPEPLIHKMMSKLDFRYISSVLEPSAGKGDLVEGIKRQFELTQRYRSTKNYDIDTIEINDDLKYVLRGKGYRVVHDNFLTYSSYKHYDAIIANFPFSEGDKHLLHALELQERRGGQIVCLLNSETLKNPYSNTRKELIKQLEKYDAEVEFIDNAFAEAERKTGVSIALVSITIPKVPYNSTILQELQQEESHNFNTYESTQMIHSDFIEGIVQQYNYEVKAGLKLIEEYRALTPYMLRSFQEDKPVLKLELEYKDNEGSSLENAYIKQIRIKYWKALFTNDQFMNLFTSNLKEKYMGMISELKDYDFSFYNIYSIRIQLSKEMIQGVEDTILNLFEEFSYKHYFAEGSANVHYYDGWATNKAYKVNKKVIIPLNAFNNWWNGQFEPTDYRVIEKLKDIEKVFRYLDSEGTDEIDMRGALMEAQKSGQTRKIELTYFYISFFKKATAHIVFKDMNLLQKFNLFGSQKRGWIPPSYGKVKYSNMTDEEKQVIDEFEGEESYNKVMANQSYYLVKTDELLKLTS